MGQVISVNVGRVRGAAWAGIGRTAMDERIEYRARWRSAGSGSRGTRSATSSTTGGGAQAVYAFAREELDWWEGELGRKIRNGQFAENLTTSGIDVDEAEVGERWRIGTALFEVAMVRIPFTTSRAGSDATASTTGPGSGASRSGRGREATCASCRRASSPLVTRSRSSSSLATESP